MSPSEIGPLPLVFGVAVARAAERLGMEAVGVKWPNDVWWDGRKLAGVLMESSAESDRLDWLVAGVGLNVRRPAQVQDGAAYLSETGLTISLAGAAATLLDEIARAWRLFEKSGFADLIVEYENRSVLTGQRVTVRGSDDSERAKGVVKRVDSLGRLIIDGPDGEVPVAAGDATLDKRA